MSKENSARSKDSKKSSTSNDTSLLPVFIVGVIAVVAVAVLIIVNQKLQAAPVTDDIVIPSFLDHPIDQVPAGEAAMGDPNAPVKVIAYEDFQCPACAAYSQQVEPTILSQYVKTGLVYYTFYPIAFLDDRSGSGESDRSAQAAYCAMDQGVFWQYHDTLYNNQNGENDGAFTDDRLREMAQKLGLDMTQFNDCFNSGKYADRVQQEHDAGLEITQQTPTITVNGTIFTGQTYQELFQMIEAAASGQGATPAP